jgi:hypothetical protein
MKHVIQAFDEFLVERKLTFAAVVIGGGALIVMDIVDRKTKDIDCLDPEIPDEIREASVEFARLRKDLTLWEKWLNNGPVSLKREPPDGWRSRLQIIFQGRALTFETLGRGDLIKSKLFAYCDRVEPDRTDLLQMKPTTSELDDAIEWVKLRDANPLWPEHVEVAFASLRKELGHA